MKITEKNASLAGRTFNVRVSFDTNGDPVLGWIHGMFHERDISGDMSITDIKRVGKEDALAVARALGLECAEDFYINRQLRKQA